MITIYVNLGLFQQTEGVRLHGFDLDYHEQNCISLVHEVSSFAVSLLVSIIIY